MAPERSYRPSRAFEGRQVGALLRARITDGQRERLPGQNVAVSSAGEQLPARWVATLETAAPDVVACWRVIDWNSRRAEGLRRELRGRVATGDAPRILAQQEARRRRARARCCGDARAAAARARRRGGLERGPGLRAHDGRPPLPRRPGRRSTRGARGRPSDAPVVTPSVPGPPDATRETAARYLDKSRSAIREAAARIAGHELQRCGMTHPLIGHLRCGEWLLFVGIHDCMHLEQLHGLLEPMPPDGPPMPERPAPLVLVATPPDGPAVRNPRRGRRRGPAAPGRRAVSGGSGASGRRSRRCRTRRRRRRAVPLGPLVHRCGPAGARRRRRSGRRDRLRRRRGARARSTTTTSMPCSPPIAGEVVANNRFSADAFVVAGDLERGARRRSRTCETDNAAPRRLDEAGFAWRDLGDAPLGAVRRRHHLRPRAPASGDPPRRTRARSTSSCAASSRWRACPATAHSRCRTSRRSAR